MNAVALQLPEQTGSLTNAEYGRLTGACRNKFDALLMGMKLLPAGHGRRAAFEGISARLDTLGFTMSAETLKRFYYGIPSGKSRRPGYRTHGEYALVDHRLCGGKCGLPGCNAVRKETLPEDTVQHWLSKVDKNDKRALRNAWKKIITMLMNGEFINGAGTWRTVYASLNPGRSLPPQCPYSTHRPPSGWSLSSFMLRLPPDYELALGKKGLFAAENALAKIAPVRTDLSNLRFMEVVVFDDHRLDFKAWVGKQVVELWAVFAMDLATRTILAWGIRPRIASDDGVKQSLTRRDVQHLIASMLQTHGLPKDYVTHWCVENAAAAITTEFENTLNRIMPDRIEIDRTSVGDGRSRGWEEKYGKPRGKRWLESFFNILEIELGATIGQMGNRWDNKPGDFDHRQKIGQKLAILGVTDQLDDCVKPFLNLEAACHALHDAILRCENREDHELVNFRTLRFWRTSERDSWKSVEDTFFLGLTTEQQNALMIPRETGLVRPETPAERREYLYNPNDFESLSPAGCFDLYLDQVETVYQGANCLTFEVNKRTFDFAGTQHRAVVGQKIQVRFDIDRPQVCVLMDLQGRVLGSMYQRRSGSYFENEDTAARLGERQKALGAALGSVRRRHADPNMIEAYDRAIDIVTSKLPKPKTTLTQAPSPMLEAYAQAQDAPQTTAAEDYLQHAEKRTEARALPPVEELEAVEADGPVDDPGF